MIRTAGIIQAVNWGVFLFPTTLYLFYHGFYASTWRLFILLVMAVILIISIHSIRGEMSDRLRFIFLVFHGLLIFQSALFLIMLIFVILINGGIPAL